MTEKENLNRRDFIKGVTVASLGAAMIAEEVNAVAAPAAAPAAASKPAVKEDYDGAPVNCAVIGLGPQGREILKSLMKMPNSSANVSFICDTYSSAGFVNKSKEIAVNAKFEADYQKVLADKSVQAVFVATPTHKHKAIVLDALKAGKHVYCEAPFATTLADAKEIAAAGAAASTVFQAGLQYRSNGMHNHVSKFVKSAALGKLTEGRAQWHRRGSWKQSAPTDERMKEINWRLYKDTSIGLAGEVGIHQLDVATWYFKAPPVSIMGFGGVFGWKADGMQVPDTIQLLVEYPNNVRFMYDATLTSSLDGAYESFLGTASSMILRDQRGWMFKESDSEMLGWEVYAKKETMAIGDTKTGTGIMLVANATKQILLGKDPGKVGTDVSKTALFQSCGSFLDCVRDPKNKKPNAGAAEGFQATVVAIKAHEAVMTGAKVTLDKEMFTI